jgi:hypothetical protein
VSRTRQRPNPASEAAVPQNADSLELTTLLKTDPKV